MREGKNAGQMTDDKTGSHTTNVFVSSSIHLWEEKRQLDYSLSPMAYSRESIRERRRHLMTKIPRLTWEKEENTFWHHSLLLFDPSNSLTMAAPVRDRSACALVDHMGPTQETRISLLWELPLKKVCGWSVMSDYFQSVLLSMNSTGQLAFISRRLFLLSKECLVE